MMRRGNKNNDKKRIRRNDGKKKVKKMKRVRK